MRKWVSLLTLLALVGGTIYFLVFYAPPGSRTLRAFDPDLTADLETDIWRVSSDHDERHLYLDLAALLHEENRYPWATACIAAFHMERAASSFADTHSGYELLLPDIQATFGAARDWTNAKFDPAAVARKELAWWVAQRIPSQNSAAQVGALIADENAMLFDVPRERVLAASVLRAQAARLRDENEENTDWDAVSSLLHQSYRQLHDAVSH